MNASGKTSAISSGSNGSAFRKPAYKKSVAILSTSGIVFGLGLSGSSQAFASTPAACIPDRIVTPAMSGSVQNEVLNMLNIYDQLDQFGVVCLRGNFILDAQVYFDRPVTVYGLETSSVNSPNGPVFQSAFVNSAFFDIEIVNLSILNSPGTAVIGGHVNVVDSNISGNSTGGNGGAILAQGDVTISNSSLTNNSASSNNGGAIRALGDVTITNSTLIGNSARYGGAISALGEVSISNGSTLTSNSASEHGGAIEAGGNVSVSSDSTLSLNTAETNGGAIFAYTLDPEFPGGVTVSNSTLSENEATLSGGAIWTDGAVTVSSNSKLSDNSAVEGGAIYSTGALTVSSTEFSENTATGGGGAIWSQGTSIFNNATFTRNISGDQGGALLIEGNSTLTDSRLTDNRAGEGGAVYMGSGSTLTITTSTLTSNRATAGRGGAVMSLSPVDISGSTLSGNRSESAEGGAVWTNSSVTISTNSTLNNNFAVQSGGAVMSRGTLNVSSSTLSGNISQQHGGALRGLQNVTISGSTLSGNEANWNGGALYVVDEANDPKNITVTNSTFADNKALGTSEFSGYGGAIFGYGSITSSRSTFTNNSARLLGGALFTQFAYVGGTVDVRNSTFIGNKALDSSSEGGAIHAHNGDVLFSTFVNNTASTGVGGIRGDSIRKDGTGELKIGANIFAGDATRAQLGIGSSQTPFSDLGGNVFSTSSSQESDLVQDPLDYPGGIKDASTIFDKSLLSLFGSSNPSLTTYSPNISGTQMLGLVAGSPSLGVVPDREPFLSLTQDQRGTTRSFPASAGAFEGVAPVEPTPTPTPTPTPNTPTAAAPSTLARTGIAVPLWLGMAAGLVTALGSIAAGVSYKLRRRTK